MQRTKVQFARVMELDRLIRDGKYPNCLTYAVEREVSQKTVLRDIEFLRDQCGAPIAYDRRKKGFHYTDPTYLLPSVVMNEGELLAMMLAGRMLEQYRGSPVAAQLDGLFGKLADLLPGKLSIRPELLHSRFTFRGPPAKPVDVDVWTAVVRGLLNQRTVAIRYRTFGMVKTQAGKESRINPCHIANLQGEWYVFGVHAGCDDVRQFAMARIETATLTQERFDPPADCDSERLLDGVFGRFAGGRKIHTVRLLFDADVAEWVTEREWHPDQKVAVRKDSAVELAFPAKGLFEVQRWVLAWGSQVRVLAPAELKMMVAGEIQAMAAGLLLKGGPVRPMERDER